ncbi:MAG TPA: sigma-70 family RNA polymerase sigma factor [Syntrophothermus lipocalidus]|uniref:RNA polymerase sigma factor n=1 Tax=Syntrophothermus lipocalidus (strain DSM 12680 / TGB-C1) TaxID=643648 RepID=D7CN88_SYNLT|nr:MULTISPECIES: sigma-70 family RNA polymerase sigma factor [Syntrophothermus]ADI02173.1 RNA polymerase, sigma-24 subunit, ECF subfamily [Syntrophothermus lipocalidus DSM 12680]NSW82022.1 sigma-70 family RNA polymerase sigma factor [Syntrophothermus sp.]HHV75984.1 sigma-70 family RNA polymerase sigma factor [Syntrophothermus lipocalidus]
MAPSDERLVHETVQGNLQAFEELVHRYQRQVFTIAYRMTNQREEAEDIAQEVFITVYQKLYQFDTSRRFAPWIQRITVNTCITRLRKKKKVVLVNFEDNISNRADPFLNIDYNDPAVVYDREELKLDLKEALLQLPESYRAMLILRYQLDMSNQEIADALGITRENVEVKMHRARKSLRKVLLERRDERRQRDELSASR